MINKLLYINVLILIRYINKDEIVNRQRYPQCVSHIKQVSEQSL